MKKLRITKLDNVCFDICHSTSISGLFQKDTQKKYHFMGNGNFELTTYNDMSSDTPLQKDKGNYIYDKQNDLIEIDINNTNHKITIKEVDGILLRVIYKEEEICLRVIEGGSLQCESQQ